MDARRSRSRATATAIDPTPRAASSRARSARRHPAGDGRRPPGDLAFGRFRLVEPIGSGGMAEVWRAHDERLGRDVALKRLHGFLVLDDAHRDRLLAEARALASLAHPNCVSVYDVVSDQSGTALVLELVEGESLADRLARGDHPDRDEALGIVEQIAAALAAGHALGIVHRDVKPGNVLVDREGRARLVDFGIAQAIEPEAHSVPVPAATAGTAPYMAPEQLRGERVSPATDVFGLAVVAYDLIAGRRPFEATTPAALEAEQRAGPPPIAGVPVAANELFRHGLAVDPRERPAATEFAGRLREVFDGDAPTLVASSAPDVVAVGTAPMPSIAERPAPGRRRIHPLAAAALLVAAIVVLAIGSSFVVGTREPRSVGAAIEPSATPFVAATASPTSLRTAAPTKAPPAPSKPERKEKDGGKDHGGDGGHGDGG